MPLTRSTVIASLAGLALGVVLTSAWFLAPDFMPLAQVPESILATTTPAALSNASGAIAVSDQAAGDAVLVDSVTVPPPGVWVAVRETGIGDTLGNVLGAARVHGPISNLSIALLRSTESGRVYAVELYRADVAGDFDPNNDSVYVDFDTGQPVVALFTAK
jgi:hypothetical protein